MPGEWSFEFKFVNKESLKVRKYQELLLKIREEFEPQFAQMKPEEGEVEWTAKTDGKAPADNMFARFTYKCTKTHQPQGPDHGTWTLLWNPKKADIKNNLHARCAPALFKELSDKIQKKLAKEFPAHFTVAWNHGLSGYNAVGTSDSSAFRMREMYRMVRDMLRDEILEDDDWCPHHIPWEFCSDCGDSAPPDMWGFFNSD